MVVGCKPRLERREIVVCGPAGSHIDETERPPDCVAELGIAQDDRLVDIQYARDVGLCDGGVVRRHLIDEMLECDFRLVLRAEVVLGLRCGRHVLSEENLKHTELLSFVFRRIPRNAGLMSAVLAFNIPQRKERRMIIFHIIKVIGNIIIFPVFARCIFQSS